MNPFEGTLLVETRAAGAYVAQTLTRGRLDSTVLPGFWIDASWLGYEELPSTLTCPREILSAA